MKKILLLVVLLFSFQISLVSAQLPAPTKKLLAPGPDVVAKLAPNKKYVNLTFKSLSTVKSFSYELNYKGNNLDQGIFGQVNKITATTLTRQLFLGTCSKKVCVSHQNVKNITLTAKFSLKNGKKTTRILTLK